MEAYQTIILIYILFVWCVMIHTLEEIAQGIFDVKLGPIKASKKKYLVGATLITTVNLATLALIVAGSTIGLYLGIFTSSVIGVLQAVVHGIGFYKEEGKARNFGVGFYSSIPLAVVGAVLLYNILEQI